ncbi:MAG: UDP-2,3-diacylglucosamine diphosphatase [Candidatus Bathyarchaeota archaeon]|nr:MAG: UDP-2,3-diacylglucosamine diphosphatase [Candidatus Bathyarchaeota archaeon]
MSETSTAEKVCVVSDIHLGFNKAQDAAFSAFLDLDENQDLDELILLGDVLDFWVADDKTIFGNMHSLLRKIQRLDCRKVLVIGNHDYILSGYIGDYIPDLQIVEDYTSQIGGKLYLFLHGHQFDRAFKLFRPLYLAGLLSALPDIQRWITNKAVSYSFTRWIWDKWLRYFVDRPKHKSFEEMVNEGYYNFFKLPKDEMADALIYGHTHIPQLTERKTKKGSVFWGNTGSWVEESEEVYNTTIFIDTKGPIICRYEWDPSSEELEELWRKNEYEPKSYLDAKVYRESDDFRTKLEKKR